MPFTLTMPKLSPTMEGGTIVKWHKKVGDQIQPGDVLLEVATDKAIVEHHALDEGWLRQILIEEGKEATVNQPIAILTVDSKENFENYQPEGISPPSQKEEKKEISEAVEEENQPTSKTEEEKNRREEIRSQPSFVPEPPLQSKEFEYPTEKLHQRIFASPLAKKIAKEVAIKAIRLFPGLSLIIGLIKLFPLL